MPIEIRELVIRAVVEPSPKPDRDAPAFAKEPPLDRRVLIQECVDQTLRILRRQKER
jgi:hypothetical protein